MRTPTVCREYLDNLLEYLYAQGATPRQLQGLMRLDPQDYISEQGRFPLRLFEMLLDAGSQLLNDYYLGAHAGAHCSSQPWGMVNYLGMSASSNREAVSAVVNYSRLLIDHGDVELSEEVNDQRAARLTWVLPPRQLPSRQVIEFFFSNWYRVNKPLLDRWCSKREIHFTHDGPADSGEIERIIEAPVHYGSHCNAVEFDRHFLDRPTKFPHSGIHKSLEQAAQAELSNLQFEDRIIRDVKECIMNQLASGVPKLEEVAANLRLTPRTLQRRLNNTNTNFKYMVDDARKERSIRLISDSALGLPDISAELGFSDQSAFQKAFKRWYGQAPGRYRLMLQTVN